MKDTQRLSRRAVLQGGTLLLGPWNAPGYQQDMAPIVRFGLVTDVHYADKPEAGTRYYRESMGKLQEAAKYFRGENLDFAVELGDLVDAATDPGTERAWLRQAISAFSQSASQTYFVLGNHCVQTLRKQHFLQEAGSDRSFYSLDKGGIRFVMLDACYRNDGVSYDAGNFDWKDSEIPASQRDWLKHELTMAPGKAVVFVHQRLDIPGVHTVASAVEVRRILEESGRVLAVFQGHSHKNDHNEINGIHYCTMRAVIEGSGPENSGYSVVSVYTDGRLHIRGFRAQREYSFL